MEQGEQDQQLMEATAEAIQLMRYDYLEDDGVGVCNGSGSGCWADPVTKFEVAQEGYISEDEAFNEQLEAFQEEWQRAKARLIERAEKATGIAGLDLHVVTVPEDDGSYRLELVLAREEHH